MAAKMEKSDVAETDCETIKDDPTLNENGSKMAENTDTEKHNVTDADNTNTENTNDDNKNVLTCNPNDSQLDNNDNGNDDECKKKRRKTSDSDEVEKDGENVPENDEAKADLKVPPLKIVLSSQTMADTEPSNNRLIRNTNQKTNQNLPYIVNTSLNENAVEKDDVTALVNQIPEKLDDKKDKDRELTSEEQKLSNQRVLRSSHKLAHGSNSNEGVSTGSPPQQHQQQQPPQPTQSQSQPQPPQPVDNPETGATSTNETTTLPVAMSSETESDHSMCNEHETNVSLNHSNIIGASSSVDIHPRKRKLKQSKDQTTNNFQDPVDPLTNYPIHPHDQPITNCYQMFLDIRKQVQRRRKHLFPVQPKPPQGFKDYLMNRCTYVLEGSSAAIPVINVPLSVPTSMKELYTDQEKDRHKLRIQHVVEKEKLVLSVEQEILRVHGRAARALANQSLPYSVCTILKDEEVYNFITPEQEEKDRNARSRYNGRLFLSWLQDVDDKWEKIKEVMLIRHHNESEALFGVQKMDWEWKLKETCDLNSIPFIDMSHIPRVHVSDDFDLLPT